MKIKFVFGLCLISSSFRDHRGSRWLYLRQFLSVAPVGNSKGTRREAEENSWRALFVERVFVEALGTMLENRWDFCRGTVAEMRLSGTAE